LTRRRARRPRRLKKSESGMRTGSRCGPCLARRARRRFPRVAAGDDSSPTPREPFSGTASRRVRRLTGHAFVVARFPLRRFRHLRGRRQ
jgi:hypothetical protein